MYRLVLLTLKCRSPFYTPFISIQNSGSFPPPLQFCDVAPLIEYLENFGNIQKY
jgi:hypothetical protein